MYGATAGDRERVLCADDWTTGASGPHDEQFGIDCDAAQLESMGDDSATASHPARWFDE